MNRQRGGKPQGRKAFSKNAKDNEKDRAPKPKPQVKNNSNSTDIRLNKYIANAGICSRREADVHIATGLVTVNGKVVTEMGYKVKPTDEVRYDGSRISPEQKAYVLLNKPKGFATTTSEGKGRTVMDLVANATSSRIKPIGRLGRNSKGLLLFTNDKDIEDKFKSSKKGVPRLFHIELDKNLKLEDLKKIQNGFKIQDKLISVEEISYVDGSSKKEVGLKIKNTGNTIIRTIFEHFNYDILSIDCVAIAHLTKKDIPRGHWKHLSKEELTMLKMI
ncbi:rRNA pseudouridine synthase [Seonamhaeicola algicola]|uniref:rRNA pseudouridine synthase n=2 Tax=Seonamhaeicola TaxID=1649495 RepID=A0A5C7AN40_9FLAO|nr:pseudouridine synthase [Seonamhaeicola algicola]TXE09741.1 rRNA pseudouridine synthase [Seonamhaeicola algicola]